MKEQTMKNKVCVDSHYREGYYVEGYYRNFPSKGYYRSELSKAFDKLTANLDHRNMPIHTNIHIGEWYLMSEACEFFTGSKLWQVKDLGLGMMEVKADGWYKGYYNAVKDERLRLKNEKGQTSDFSWYESGDD